MVDRESRSWIENLLLLKILKTTLSVNLNIGYWDKYSVLNYDKVNGKLR
jgi:hypothetical protein